MAEAAFQRQLSEGGLGINHLASFVNVGSHFTPCLPASSCCPPTPTPDVKQEPWRSHGFSVFPGQ